MRICFSHRLPLEAFIVLTLACLSAPPANAQDLFVPSDRTIASGNPINGNYNFLWIGYDAQFNEHPGVTADFIGGNISYASFVDASTLALRGGYFGDTVAYNNSVVNVLGGAAFYSNKFELYDTSRLNVYGKRLTVYDLSYYQPGNLGQYFLSGVSQSGSKLQTHLNPLGSHSFDPLTFNGATVDLNNIASAIFLPGSYTVANGNPINDSRAVFVAGRNSSFSQINGLQEDFVGGHYDSIDGYSDAVINFNGGGVGRLSEYDNAVLTVNGGQTVYVNAYDNSVATINNGAQALGVSAYDYSTVTINSGAFVFGADSHDYSTLNVYGQDGGAYNAYDSSQINYTGPYVFNYSQLFAHDTSYVNVNDGYLRSAFVSNNADLQINGRLFGPGGGVGYAEISGRGFVSVNSGGHLESASLLDSGSLAVNDGVDVYDVAMRNGSNLSLTGNGHYTNARYIRAFDSSSVSVTAASADDLKLYDQSSATIRDGDLHQDGHSYYNVRTLNAYNASITTVSDDGGVLSAALYDFSVLNINGGAIGGANCYGASVLNLNASRFITDGLAGHDSSQINISGGIVGDVYGYDYSVTNMYGGSLASFFGFDSSVFNLYGGIVGPNTISLLDFSAARLYGTGLTLSSALGQNSDANGLYTDYLLTGFLNSGDALNTHLHYYGSGASLYFNDAAIITGTAAAPEPGTLALLIPLLGVMALVARRRAPMNK